MVSVNEADAASLAKGVLVPNRTIVATIHETADRPGSSDATVTWCWHRAPSWAGSPAKMPVECLHGSDAAQ